MERLPGFRDFYPEPVPHPDSWSADARQHVFQLWRTTARKYGFREYDGPPLEPLELYTTKSGDEIVGQLYNFNDKGDRAVALRPEMTPTLARMVAAHERSYKKPIKWFALPQLFRYERQQRGRLREHFQLNADIIGESSPAADAELIALLIDVLKSFGLTSQDFVVRLSSRLAWHEFYSSRSSDSGAESAFYQVVDKLDPKALDQSEAKLKALGFSLDEITDFINAGKPTPDLAQILEDLTARGLADFARVDYHVIRGLAYYTGVVFEAFDVKGELRAIAGGGRYDSLIKLVSGGKLDLPALGFGMGDVVLLELLKERKLLPKFDAGLDAFFLVEDESLRRDTLGVVQSLRNAGLTVDYALTPSKPDKQFKRATELKTRYALKLSRAPDGSLIAKVRNFATRQDQDVSVEALARYLAGS